MSTAQKKKPRKITADTNVLISGLIYPGKTVVQLFDRIFEGELELGVSEAILNEFIRVCIIKLEYDPIKTMDITTEIRGFAEMVNTMASLNVIKDEPDNRVLECAVAFRADCVISGDKHILALKKYRGIKILSPAEFIKRYG